MHGPIQLTNAIPSARISLSPATAGRGFLLLVFPLALAWFALSPAAQAVTPAPDGDYPGNHTAEGTNALFSLTTANNNTAIGFFALRANTSGNANTCIGFEALFNNTTGKFNAANGANALLSNTTGNANTAGGANALLFNTIGIDNTATGSEALFSNTTGGRNTANGKDALGNNTTGSSNIALGYQAGVNLTTGSNNIDIGNVGDAGEANTIRIGTVGMQNGTFISGIFGVTVNGSAVVVNSNGKLGVTTSSARFKQGIKPMEKASEAILALEPVTFRYKQELDPDGIPQFGLIAEQVEKVNPDLVARDADGKVNTVRYEAVNAMLLNEFLKEHRKVAEQQKAIAVLAAQLKEQAALIQKVSDRLEVSKFATGPH
jgi:Chaperone of endosialidase